MHKVHLLASVLCTTLLQACVSPARLTAKPMEPVFRVSHSALPAASTYYNLGKYHQQRGNLKLAQDAYRHSISLDAKGLDARNALAAVLSQQGKLEEAKALLLSIIQEHPEAPHPYNNLGYLHYLQGNHEIAISYFEQSLSLDKQSERARNNLKAAQAARLGTGHPVVQASAGPATGSEQDTAPAAPDRQQATSRADDTPPRAQSQIVQLAPNVYELKVNQVIAPSHAEQPQTIAPAVGSADASRATGRAGKLARIQVANGNGVANMAKRVRNVLGRQGIPVHSLANVPPYVQKETRILYRHGYEDAARAMQLALRGSAVMVSTSDLPAQLDVRLVLGKQAVTQLAGLDRPEAPAPLLAGTPPTQVVR